MAGWTGLEAADTAFRRFGLGPREGFGLSDVAGDPRGALQAEVEAGPARPVGPDLLSSVEALTEDVEFQTERRKRRAREEERLRALAAATPPPPGDAPPATPPRPAPPAPSPAQRGYQAEAMARVRAAREAPVGFAERLVWFWANHFAVSASKSGAVRITAGAYEREAVRPHVFGRFADMLGAVAKHPAMLIYLDNRQSTGPNSRAGERRGRGLNENWAREILELHTLGVGGGYAQDDVTSLARVLTGWTVVGPADEDAEIGAFHFNPNRHEPGPQVVLGRRYPAGGVEQGEAALADLARHPSTARHVATKLARHFVADDPPPPLVDELAAVFRQTDGDLRALSLALANADAAWSAPHAKLRSPQEFLLAAERAFGVRLEIGPIQGALAALGQPVWTPPGPNGYPDGVAHWALPEGVRARLDVANLLARRASASVEPRALADRIFGPRLSDETATAIRRAESRPQALALLAMSPEFQRR